MKPVLRLALIPLLAAATLYGCHDDSTTTTTTGGGSGGGGGSSTSTSGTTAAFIVNGVTNILTPGSGGASGDVSLVSFPNSGSAVGALTTTTVTIDTISTSLTSVGGTSVDPAKDLGLAYGYDEGHVSFISLTTRSEVSLYDTGSTQHLNFSGGQAIVPGAIMDTNLHSAIIATYDGFNVVDYADPANPVLVRNIESTNKNPSGGIHVTENFGYDPGVPLGGSTVPLILTGVYASSGNILELADPTTGNIYIPDAATNALFTVNWVIDQIAADTTYHVAVLADEGDGITFVDLRQLTLGTTPDADGYYTYTLPASAVNRLFGLGFYEYDNVAIESTSHLVFIGEGFGGNSFLIGKLDDPDITLGFVDYTATAINMPADTDDQGNSVSWSGPADPHGGAAYLTADDHPTFGEATPMALWSSWDKTHVAVINMRHVLNNYDVAGYDPLFFDATHPKDVAYFYLVP